MTTPKIAVIIPFFQRESGILARSLLSISNQGYPTEALYVIVIDDGSPVPAEGELLAHPVPVGLRVKVIRRENSGPNEARNTGLENLEPDTDLVAYLDSDDEWIGEHIARAIKALSAGYTAYFANLYHLGDNIAEFEKAKRVRPEDHPMVIGDPTLREYHGDMIHQISAANIIFMPSLVIDAKVLGSARFPMAHRHGGGDYLYWMDLIQHGAKFVFSTQPEVRCGSGINMWYGSGWGTDGLAKRILDEARFRYTVFNRYAKAPETRNVLWHRITELHVLMLQDAVHRLRHRKPIDWPLIRRFYREVPPSSKMLLMLAKRLVRQ
jgi:succinoglycan biosynthesis protein ExoW